MNQADDSTWPVLERITEGYKKGEILVITGGRQSGRSRLAELALLKAVEQDSKPIIAFEGDLPKSIVIEAQEQRRDPFGFPNGKRRKPKKRKLKRKFRP